jgi:(aminoalkyl)phosphonate N-acetyltransferase
MMNTRLRSYSEADVPFIKAAFERLHDHVVSIDPIKRMRKMPGYVEVFFGKLMKNISNNQGQMYIVEDTGKPVGFVAGFVADKQSEENLLEVVPTQLGIISDVYLDKELRGKGIGKQMMKKMEEYLKKKGCDSLWITTNGFNSNALGLYRSVGFVEREVGLLKKLS